jgi:hypothetical protein
MPEAEKTLNELREQEYERRLVVDRLRREIFQQPDPSASKELRDELAAAEQALVAAEEKRMVAQEADPTTGLILDTHKAVGLLGPETTGLEAKIHLRMAHVPTAICHLFNREAHPLVSCSVRNAGNGGARRVRVTTHVEGYSARAVDTAELSPHKEYVFRQIPTFFPEQLRGVTELTRATLNVLVEDLDGKVELHRTEPIWLLARTTAPLAVQDPKTGEWQDLTPYCGAFVTPNAPSLMHYLRVAADFHPDDRLIGYQGDESQVEDQVKAIFMALKINAGITYVNSVIDFNPDQGSASQRVRLPRESLADKQANCIDGTVLFASLLEGISMSPAIVIVPGHAFVAWETWQNSNQWKYLETTMIGTRLFDQACVSAENTAAHYKSLADSTKNPYYFRRWPLRVLRSQYGITPME